MVTISIAVQPEQNREELFALFSSGGVVSRACRALEPLIEAHLVDKGPGSFVVHRPNDHLLDQLPQQKGEVRSACYNLWAGLAVTQSIFRMIFLDHSHANFTTSNFPAQEVQERFDRALTHLGENPGVVSGVELENTRERVLAELVLASRDLKGSMEQLGKIVEADITEQDSKSSNPLLLSNVFNLLRSGSERIIESIEKLDNTASLPARV